MNSFSESSGTVTLDLSGNDALITVDKLKIWYGGSNCVISNADLSALTCDVAAIQAGDLVPLVLAEGFGFANYAGAATAVDPVVTSLDITTGSTQGGKIITITGTGFPISNNNKGDVVVSFGTAAAEVLSVGNTSIRVK